jgi:1-acyl-sn-glycerol-3-phosphate acyltransferase
MGQVLALAMVIIGLIAFILACGALLVSPVFPKLRYSANLFFTVPFSWFTRKLVGIKLVILNRENGRIHRPCIMVGNHQTGLDFALISQGCPGGMIIVAKRELIRIPIFGWFFALAGNLLIDRSNPRAAKKQMDDARELLQKQKINLAVFPEGTRSRTQEMLPFKKGAFHVAVSMGFPIVPIVSSNLKGKAIWETGQLGGGYVVVSVLEPIETKGIELHQIDAFRNEVRNKMVAEYARITELAKSYDEGIKERDESCCK